MKLLRAKTFLKAHASAAAGDSSAPPLLLAFSGGPDSRALLHLLTPFYARLHLAHVDHGWREESRAEAIQLRHLADSLGLPFHLHTLKPHEGGTEVQARHERLAFFKRLYGELHAEALLLGHQADDQAETVLKRLFEGASLFALKGMREVSHLEGMTVWRPLLSHTKEEVYTFLAEEGLASIEDATNSDPRFLRARMRLRLLPDLEREFGKSVRSSLCKLGEEAAEWEGYLERRIQPYRALITRQEGGISFDLSSLYPFEDVELAAFLKRLSVEEGLDLPRGALLTLAELLKRGSSGKKVISHRALLVVRGKGLEIKFC